MSMLPFLALAVAQQSYYNTQRILNNSSMSSHKRRSTSSSSYSSSSSHSKPKLPEKMSKVLESAKDRKKDYVSYFDLLVIRAIHSDEKAKNAILKLSENYTRIHNENLAAINTKILTFKPIAQTYLNKVTFLKDQVANLGFIISSETMYGMYYPSGKNDSGKITYSTPKLPYTFNGVKLTAEMVKSGINPYQEVLDKFNAKHPNIENQYEEMMKKHDALAKKKLLLKLSRKKRRELSDLNYNAKNLKCLCETKQEHIKHVEHYASLNDSQKQMMLALFDACDKVKDVCGKVKNLDSTHTLLNGYSASNDKKQQKYSFYLESLLVKSSKCLSEEEKQALIDFEAKAAEKILSLTDEKAKQILSTFSGREACLDIDGEKIPNEILYELSDSCLEFIDSMTQENQSTIEAKDEFTK